MHGLTTIHQLNELAAQNAAGAPEAAIAAADERRAGKTSQFDTDIAESIAAQNAEREAHLEHLAGLHPLELVGLVQQSQITSRLEVALANKLAYVYSLLAERQAANSDAFQINGSNLEGLETAGDFPHTDEASRD